MLNWEPFSAVHQSDVNGFFCGEKLWEKEVENFIRGDGASSQALTMLANRRAEIWLYKLVDTGELVGFGALSKPKWTIDGTEHKITLLQAFGVQAKFHGQPAGPPDGRYATQILADLQEKAIGYGRAIWGLFVHKENAKAKAFYMRNGFVKIEEVRDTHERMFLRLPDVN